MAVIPSKGAQDWVNKKYGSIDTYTGMQQGKYDNALRSNDADMIARLKADALKVGYKLSTPVESSLNLGVRSDAPAAQSGPNPSGPNPSSMISGLYDASLQAQMQKLKAARDTQLAGLAGQDDLVKQSAYSNRNQSDVVAMQNAQKLREAMANQGILNSGDNLTAMAQGNAQRQGALGDININEANQLKQLMAARDAINNNAAADELALTQQNQADRAGAMLGQFNQDRSYGLQLGGLTGMMNGQRTLAGQQFDWGRNMDTANMTGNYNGTRTLAGQAADLNKAQTMASLTGKMPNGQPTTAEQQRQLSNLWTVAQQTGTIPNQLADMYKIPRGTRTQDAIQQAASIDQGWDASNRGWDDNSRLWTELDYNTRNPSGAKYSGLSANEVLNTVESRYTEKDGNGKSLGLTKDPMKREQMFLDVVDMGLPSDTQTNQVLNGLGLTKSEIDAFKRKYGSGK